MSSLKVKIRGATSLEMKSRYVLSGDGGRRRQRISSSTHFFFPASFRVTPETYESARFYADSKSYVRFDTPVFDVESLLAPDSEQSPLSRLNRIVDDARLQRRFSADAFYYESKLLAAVFKSLLRRSVGGGTGTEAADSDPSDPFDDEFDPGENQRGEESNPELPSPERFRRLHKVVRRVHKLSSAVLAEPAGASVHDHCRMIDEHVSLLLERYLSRYFEYVNEKELEAPGRKRIAKILIAEARYRKKAGYPTAPDPDLSEEELERYIYREKTLKKYASEVLFLATKVFDEAKTVEHVLYALAAGIAMVFATAVAFYAQSRFSGLGVALFALLVTSYMIKDRLKDIFRSYFRRSAGSRFYDRRTSLYDSVQDKKVALVRERVLFHNPGTEDPAIVRARGRGPFEMQLERTAAETQLIYQKQIDIRSKILRRVHNRIRGFAVILILDLEPLLHHLADQSSTVPTVSDGNLTGVRRVNRVYHLNLIVDNRWRGERRMSRFRLIVDRTGIRRVEPVPLDQR